LITGETIEAKMHENVTMLFSDIVGFTSICSTATPMMIVTMLQNLYTQFDAYCGQLDIYKVKLQTTFDLALTSEKLFHVSAPTHSNHKCPKTKIWGQFVIQGLMEHALQFKKLMSKLGQAYGKIGCFHPKKISGIKARTAEKCALSEREMKCVILITVILPAERNRVEYKEGPGSCESNQPKR